MTARSICTYMCQANIKSGDLLPSPNKFTKFQGPNSKSYQNKMTQKQYVPQTFPN